MPSYTIQRINPQEQFTGKYGTMQVYALEFAEYNGPVMMNQKVATPAPLVGAVLEGEIIRDERGNPKFKKAFNQNQPSTGGGTSSQYKSKDNGEGMAWGNSLTNAVALVVKFSKAKDTMEAVDETLAVATSLFNGRPDATDKTTFSDGTPVPTSPQGADVIPTEVPEGGINLDDIPF